MKPGATASRMAVVRDHIEAIAVAVAMALVIKHFCVEAFKIPTGSMYPTLHGDKHGDVTNPNGGDRILVDKLAYLFHGPERWDVVVFRYPLNASKHFIKRVAGLPGEDIRIRAGDIWVRAGPDDPWRIATKVRRVREELYVPVFPPNPSPKEARPRHVVSQSWRSDELNAWRVESAESFVYAGGSRAELRYGRTVTNHTDADDPHALGGTPATDVRIRARVTAGAEATVSLVIQDEGQVAELRLAPPGTQDGSALAVRRGAMHDVEPIDAVLAPGVPLDVELEVVDGEVFAHVGGREVAHVRRDAPPDPDAAGRHQRIAIVAEGGTVRTQDVRIDRDLWYVDAGMSALDPMDRGVSVPHDAYFMLGDHTGDSADSRQWRRSCVRLEDGTLICWDAKEAETRPVYVTRDERTLRRVVDVHGLERWWDEADETEDGGEDHEPVPFVARSEILGRAFVVFWPLFRLRFIH